MMSIKGQPTSLAERVEIGERWQAGQVVQAITELRQAHPGWGPLTLLTELQLD
jgi:hypothetical protein